MITYEQALRKIFENSFPLKTKLVSVNESLGLTLAKDVFSPEDFPSFDNSAVDGYAVGLSDGSTLKLQGEVPAGGFFKGTLKWGHAIQVFTGAPVPRGAEAVVMQENTREDKGDVFILKKPRPGDNIRSRGEDVEKGELLLRKGTTLEPAHLALLAAVGYQQVPVYPAPKIAILATGSELLKKGGKARPGMIHDSNTVFLESLVKKTGGIPYPFANVGDDPEEIRKRVRKGLSFDLVLVSGGVSVGKYDFVKEIFRKEGIQEIFWKVDIKPGKPLFLGRKRRTLVFGLPGNPVSVFVCFEEFVKPAILRMQGKMKLEGDLVPGRLRESFRNGPRLHFVRVRCIRKKDESIVIPLKGQGSHMIGELASAHALLKVEPNTFLKRNQLVSVKMIGDL